MSRANLRFSKISGEKRTNFALFHSYKYGRVPRLHQGKLYLLTQAWIPEALRAIPPFAQQVEQVTLIIQFKNVEIDHGLRRIGIDDSQHKAINGKSCIGREVICLWRAHFPAERDTSNDPNDNKREKGHSERQPCQAEHESYSGSQNGQLRGWQMHSP